MKPLRVGISTCPNDTFAYGALLERDGGPYEFVLDDVQALNERARGGDLDVFKLSAAAALRLADSVVVLPAGGAFGFGVGPVVLSAADEPEADDARVLCPGADTTAHLLWRVFHPESRRVEQRVFSDIVPALLRGDADLGVCIHEARFTYRERGLHLWGDLGSLWERVTGLPLPLGVVGARRDVWEERRDDVRTFVRELRSSIASGHADPSSRLPVMRRYAQEFDDAVLMKHVELYVNAWTTDLGLEGRAALHELFERARDAGFTSQLLPPTVVEVP
ncbi:MAG: MqnA/MqnD/SBP family protein [Planctomycetota bacterium]